MFDKITAIILIAICVGTGIWGWWMENGPERNNDSDGVADRRTATDTEVQDAEHKD